MISTLVKSPSQPLGCDIHEYSMPESHLLRAGLSEIFAAHQINCVIDVGANHGQFGDFLRQIGYIGRIVSFEPVSSNFKLLAQRSKNDPAWHVHNLAAGAANQILGINVMKSDLFSSFLPTSSYGGAQFAKEMVVTRTEQVQVVRLDSMMHEITKELQNPRVYLKMDTQGFDLQVLEGATGCMPQILGLQSEISLQPIYEGTPNYLTALAKLNESGFSVTSFIPVTRDEHLRAIEFDCLMVRSAMA
jgi:FkbM family methyltransferase